MKIGDLVKWNKQGKEYGHLGIVVEVHPKGNYTVHWILDNENEWYHKGTKWVTTVDTNSPNIRSTL